MKAVRTWIAGRGPDFMQASLSPGAGYLVWDQRMTIPLHSSELAVNAHTIWQMHGVRRQDMSGIPAIDSPRPQRQIGAPVNDSSNLGTAASWHARSRAVRPGGLALINGAQRPASSGATFEGVSPIDGRGLA